MAKYEKFPYVTLLLGILAVLMIRIGMPTLFTGYQITATVMALLMTLGTVTAHLLGQHRVVRVLHWVTVYYTVVTFIIMVIYYISAFMVITDERGLESVFQEHLSTAKWIYFALCFAQPIMLPIPEAVTVVAGSSAFGAFPAFAIGFAGTWLGEAVMFTASRIGGLKLVQRLIQPSKLEQYHKYVSKNETVIMILLFIIPVLPDELVCVGAGISGVSPKRFLLIAAVSKLLTSSILAYSVYLAQWLALTPTQMILSVSGIALLVCGAYFAMRKKAARSN
ncbi:TVP38/TMEM64 family protein [Paenibacillus gansuensis]|uniref:TVP38/TMEM64 family protein n=1 Tax=Paenibacillus gansuensis TaxID=306542 RepID=A0ABW5PBN6_9BACL